MKQGNIKPACKSVAKKLIKVSTLSILTALHTANVYGSIGAAQVAPNHSDCTYSDDESFTVEEWDEETGDSNTISQSGSTTVDCYHQQMAETFQPETSIGVSVLRNPRTGNLYFTSPAPMYVFNPQNGQMRQVTIENAAQLLGIPLNVDLNLEQINEHIRTINAKFPSLNFKPFEK